MGAYDEELVTAGAMLDGGGLRPSSHGARVRFDDEGNPTVVDGPFTETRELVSGYRVFEVSSREEAVRDLAGGQPHASRWAVSTSRSSSSCSWSRA